MMKQELSEVLQKHYQEAIKPDHKSSYRILSCGPPWLGAMLSHITYCSLISHQTGHDIHISANDSWRMMPGGRFTDCFQGLAAIDDSEFPLNNLDNPTYKFHYQDNGYANLNNFATEAIKYHYPPELIDIMGTTDTITLNDIWKSFLLKRIYKLTPMLQTLVDHKVQALNIPEEYAAVHIRRGDKTAGPIAESKAIPVGQYFACCRYTGYKNVFVSTDSPEVLTECYDLFGNEFNIMHDESEIRNDGYPYKIQKGIIKENPFTVMDELITGLKNIHILSHSSYLIGTKASWFFRISQLLRDYDKISAHAQAEAVDNIPGYPHHYCFC